MLTKRENLLETIGGGNPDRFVNQYEFMHIIASDPYNMNDPYPEPGQHDVVNSWGVTLSWPEGTPGGFPNHAPDKIVVQDIAHWKDYVQAPNLKFAEAEWEPAIAEMQAVNRNDEFVAPFVALGLFERCHYLCEIKNMMVYYIANPDEVHDLIEYLTEWELEYAETLCSHLHPDALFHHDDWGSQVSTFLSPSMFEEFFLDAYKQIYGYYKAHGVELIVHHSDSYAATLVPDMIDMGIDIWQGVMTTNDVPNLIKEYGGRMSFMGDIDSASVDHPDWTEEEVAREVRRACTECGTLYFIPNASQGLAMSTFPGVYEALTSEIDNMSKEMFH